MNLVCFPVSSALMHRIQTAWAHFCMIPHAIHASTQYAFSFDRKQSTHTFLHKAIWSPRQGGKGSTIRTFCVAGKNSKNHEFYEQKNSAEQLQTRCRRQGER